MNTTTLMRFLVLGASGFIGSRIWSAIQKEQWQSAGTQTRNNQSDLFAFDLAKDRILDRLPKSFLEAAEPCFVIHCSTFGSPDECAREFDLSQRVNVSAIEQLIRDLGPFSVRHVYLSSSYVFDGKTGQYCETDACRPICEYGRQKVQIETILRDMLADPLILRLDKVVGTDPDERHLFAEWNRLLVEGRPIRCIRQQTLSPILVEDVANVIIDACRANLSGLYHVAGWEGIERLDLAKRLQQAVAMQGTITEEPAEAFSFADPRPLHSDLDGSALRAAIQFHPRTLDEMLSEFARRKAKQAPTQPSS